MVRLSVCLLCTYNGLIHAWGHGLGGGLGMALLSIGLSLVLGCRSEAMPSNGPRVILERHPENRAQPLPQPTRSSPPAPATEVPAATVPDPLRIDSARLAELRRVVPDTLPESGDARDPAYAARRFVSAVLESDAKRFAAALHVSSSVRPPASKAEWSRWRVELGCFDGIAGWTALGLDPPEVVVILQPSPGVHSVALIHLRFAPIDENTGESGNVSGWGVSHVQTLFDAEWVCPKSRWIVSGLDSRVRQPHFTGDEAPKLQLLEDVPFVARQVVTDAAQGRMSSVEPRLMSADEWQSTWPPELRTPPPPEWHGLANRLSAACRGDTPFVACVMLAQFQLANSPALWARALLVFGQVGDIRRVYWTEWRTIHGIFKLAELCLIPTPLDLDDWLKRSD